MFQRFPFAHTFSIVARDVSTGQLGVAVQSHWFSVGGTVAWAEAGVGAVATQAFAEVSYGPLGLAQMRSGSQAADVLSDLLGKDSQREVRQVSMVDAEGHVAAHTGSRCMAYAGHEIGDGFTAQANMMLGPEVWPAMATAYRQSTGDLAERLLSALEAGQAAGGDIRGKQSAAILVVEGKPSNQAWANRLFDLRVEDHPEPLVELRRLVTIQRAYSFMNAGDTHLAAGRVAEALSAYQDASAFAPDIVEIPFWNAVTLADLGRLDEALPIFRKVFEAEPIWKDVLRRLPPTGMIRDDPTLLSKIINGTI